MCNTTRIERPREVEVERHLYGLEVGQNRNRRSPKTLGSEP